jgi:hypothetical protein
MKKMSDKDLKASVARVVIFGGKAAPGCVYYCMAADVDTMWQKL